MVHHLTPYFAFLCPLDGFAGVYGNSPFITPKKLCTRLTDGFSAYSHFFFTAQYLSLSRNVTDDRGLLAAAGRPLIDSLI